MSDRRPNLGLAIRMVFTVDLEDVARKAKRVVEVRGHSHGLSLEDREDLLQEVLAKYVAAWPDGTTPENVDAWLETVTGRMITDRWRAEQRRVKQAAPLKDADDPFDVVADVMEKARSRQASMPAVGDALIDQIFALVSDKDARLLKSRYVDDASAADIAEELGISRASVDQRVARAKGSLREALKARPDLAVELRASHPKAY